ncbi:MAG: sulfurtransferase TusA family protein [Promethearchaeota archaeon]|jgi:tRNA 2-thiouridine synthesizing protein A
MGNNYELNCTGLVCPLPVAKTKRKLLELQSGDILEISGDFAEAGENIKRYIDKTENQILIFEKEGENFFIKIQKA